MPLNTLTYWRGIKELTVRELAQKAGVSPNTISVLEQGHRKGTIVVLGKLARALEVDLREFADLLETPPKDLTATNLESAVRHNTAVGAGTPAAAPIS
jgi:transcriptional regulator with XRE-family HTH domain